MREIKEIKVSDFGHSHYKVILTDTERSFEYRIHRSKNVIDVAKGMWKGWLIRDMEIKEEV